MNNSQSNFPLISIIIPVYNVASYVSRCLQSVVNQSYENLEIIVVDDGSTDDSGSICDEFANRDPRIRIIHKINGGLSSARNAGLDIAKGEYIGFVDSDDYIEPKMYELLFDACHKNGCSLSVCGINYVFENGTCIKKADIEPSQVMPFYRAIREMNEYRLFDMAAWNKLYKACLFENIRFPEGKLSEDFFIMPQLFDRAKNIAFVTNALYNYYQREGSITKSCKINHDFEEAAFRQLCYLEKNHSELVEIGKIAYASSVLTVFDFYIKSGVRCPKKYIRHAKNVVKKYARPVSKVSSPIKRMQFLLFRFSVHIYTVIFIIYRFIKKV